MRSALIAIACLAACGHKASPPALRVILATGHGAPRAMARGATLARAVLLLKPYDEHQMTQAIEAARRTQSNAPSR